MLKQIPNALTLLRLVLAPVVAWLMWMAMQPATGAQNFSELAAHVQKLADAQTLAAILFVVAALTDLFDGMIARALDAHSKFGRMIDPIADKALVGLPLLVIAFGAWQRGSAPDWLIIVTATAIIVGRDVLMTVVRLVAPDGEGARVSSLAKWKTALELIVVGSYLVTLAVLFHLALRSMSEPMEWAEGLNAYMEPIKWFWLGLLVLAAALSAWTAFRYLAPNRKS